VASGKAKYALYDERTKQLYIIENSQVEGSKVEGGTLNANVEQYLGQRVTITGTLAAAPEKRAGQMSSGQWPVSSGEPEQTSEPVVVRHTPRAGVALDTSTPVAGVLTIATVEATPLRAR
jgi:hypothetical protein